MFFCFSTGLVCAVSLICGFSLSTSLFFSRFSSQAADDLLKRICLQDRSVIRCSVEGQNTDWFHKSLSSAAFRGSGSFVYFSKEDFSGSSLSKAARSSFFAHSKSSSLSISSASLRHSIGYLPPVTRPHSFSTSSLSELTV